uniref:Uncharacterized protein n=1 Tax=Lotus japonicus TaxID=34305 RepID=I3S7R9_LOTJA|nr:unknown [Lotus japonicus]
MDSKGGRCLIEMLKESTRDTKHRGKHCQRISERWRRRIGEGHTTKGKKQRG